MLSFHRAERIYNNKTKNKNKTKTPTHFLLVRFQRGNDAKRFREAFEQFDVDDVVRLRRAGVAFEKARLAVERRRENHARPRTFGACAARVVHQREIEAKIGAKVAVVESVAASRWRRREHVDRVLAGLVDAAHLHEIECERRLPLLNAARLGAFFLEWNFQKQTALHCRVETSKSILQIDKKEKKTKTKTNNFTWQSVELKVAGCLWIDADVNRGALGRFAAFGGGRCLEPGKRK